MQSEKTVELHPGLPEMPSRIAKLPVFRGYPVPFFVDYICKNPLHAEPNGNPVTHEVGSSCMSEPEFRAMDPRKLKRCYQERLCWVCGEPLGKYLAFVIGPMCAVNRITSELPNHRECAEWAVKACPFLSMPKARYRPGLPDGSQEPAGICLDRNPGVAMIWITRTYSIFRAEHGNAGYLVDLGEPEEILAYCEGRKATHAESMPRFRRSSRQSHDAARRISRSRSQ